MSEHQGDYFFGSYFHCPICQPFNERVMGEIIKPCYLCYRSGKILDSDRHNDLYCHSPTFDVKVKEK